MEHSTQDITESRKVTKAQRHKSTKAQKHKSTKAQKHKITYLIPKPYQLFKPIHLNTEAQSH